MNILFAADTHSKYPTNPYLIQLIESLSVEHSVQKVGYGADLLRWDNLHWDVIHFQWPEAVFGWRKPGWRELARVEARLSRHKKRAKIVSTIHNHDPAPSFQEVGADVFEMIYANTDAFIHLGRASFDAFKRRYRDRSWLDSAAHRVIPHGDYSYYLRLQKDESVLEEVKPDGRPIVLVFGALRSADEEQLAREAFLTAGMSRARLVFAGAPSRGVPREVIRGEFDPPDGRIVRLHRRVPHEQVRPLFEAASIVFIPRSGRLNSGVLPLAMTYGVPVVAPAEGVIGEMVEESGGLLYEPGNVSDAASQLRRAVTMDSETRRLLVDQMRDYGARELSWSSIARKHLRVYVECGVGSFEAKSADGRLERLSRSWQCRAMVASETKGSATAPRKSASSRSSYRIQARSICFSIALNGYERRFRECIQSQERYCLRYGYRYWRISDLPWLMTPRQCAWLKVEIMRGLLANGAPHVGFLDADCEFRPHAPPFEGEYVDDSAILMATGKSGRLNSGVMFGKSTPILIDFLEMLISKADTEVPKEDRTAYENGHFIHYGRSVNFIRVLDHRKWNNNSELDALSYVQHFSGGELRRWWDEQKKWTSSAVPSEGEGKEDVTDISVSEFLFIARKHLSVRYPELVSTQRRVIVN